MSSQGLLDQVLEPGGVGCQNLISLVEAQLHWRSYFEMF